MKRKWLLTILAVALPFLGVTQTSIVAAEYFFDTDPGIGNATSIPITPSTTIDVTFAADASALSVGLHFLGVRVQNDTLAWGITAFTAIYVFPNDPTVSESIVAAEYFFDNDPGIGNGTAITGITPGSVIDISAAVDASALSRGIHLLGIRTQNSNGLWGLPAFSAFDVDLDLAITKLEYFIDTDPGTGNATEVTIAPPTLDVDTDVIIPTSSLPVGTYSVGTRAAAGDDIWGGTVTHTFTVCSFADAAFSVTQSCEGNATVFTDNSTNLQPGDLYSWDFESDGTTDATSSGDQTFTYPAVGSYTATLTIDRGGCVDTFTLPVNIDPLPIADAGADQTICGDDGTLAAAPLNPGEEGAWTFITGTGTITDPSDPASTFSGITSSAEVEWTVTITATGCSASDQAIINGTSVPSPSFSVTTVCAGTATTFTDNSTNTSAGDVYSWDFDNDGVEDDATVGSTTFTYPSAGTYTATLEISRAGCSEVFTVDVDVEAEPVADAGSDQDICVNTAALAGSVPGTGESGLWTIVSGTATITDATDPSTTITGISSYTTVLEWTVTNSAGGCSQADQVTIVSNQPILAAAVDATATLGETTNVDVQSSATVNPGDVLTTSILTQGAKGTALVAPNGSINYTPDDGTVGSDVVVYQVCNQCNRCASNNLEIEILNNPPVITPEPVIATGTTVTLNLLSLITDPNNNLDPSTLAITEQPVSGAVASIDASYNLIVDYAGVVFSGTDFLAIEACDFAGECATSVILIEVDIQGDPPIYVFNAVSPNGDGKHDYLQIENIEFYPDNHIFIVNRWGDKVFEAVGYNNDQIKFEGFSNVGGGSELPSGTYFYSVDLKRGTDRVNGFLVLKR